MTPRDVLVKARDLIATPERWIKGADKIVPTNGAQCMFCARGAVEAVGHFADPSVVAARDRLSLLAPVGSIQHFNDARSTTHADVLALFDRAIAAEGP